MESLELYTYCKSSAAYRVRIALNLKELVYTPHYVSLINDGGENYKPEYTQLNPQAMVPALKIGTRILTQSTAIIEWLEEHYPAPPLLPADDFSKAVSRSYAQVVACDIHPLNNLRVLDYIKVQFDQDEAAKRQWYQHWIHQGFSALETRLRSSSLTGNFCIGDSPSMADIFLVPQVYNANRYQCDMEKYPVIRSINENCLKMKEFINAAPENQQDYIN